VPLRDTAGAPGLVRPGLASFIYGVKARFGARAIRPGPAPGRGAGVTGGYAGQPNVLP